MKKTLAFISTFALITITPNGKIVQRVLGDSTFEVKKIAENITFSDGKIELNNANTTNSKEDLVEVEARANTNDLKIGSSQNKFTIEENNVIAVTDFPITIDAAKNTLSVTTKTGTRLLTILPYEATVSLTRAKLIDNLKGNQIDLSENPNGSLEYLINGNKNINLFNIATITANVNSTVSATTGEVLKIDEPQWLKLFGFIWQ